MFVIQTKHTFMNYLKHLVLSFITLSLFCSFGFSQDLLPYKNGKLEGPFQYYDSLTGLTTWGSFENNTRSGEWTIKNEEGKIVYQRKYESYFSFDEKKIYQNKASHSKYKHPIERNANGLYIYPEIDNKNVLWSKRVWSVLPEKHHGQLYSQEVLIKISKWFKEDKIKVYKDDEMSKLIPEVNSNISNQKIEGVTIKKDYYFDKSTHLMQERIIAITFHLKDNKTGKNQALCIYYPTDGRKLLSSFKVHNESQQIEHYDDIIFFQNYVDIIYNEANAYGKKVSLDFSDIEQYQQTSNDIKALIINQEHRLWLED